jgi:hypothetical protein
VGIILFKLIFFFQLLAPLINLIASVVNLIYDIPGLIPVF